MVKQAAENPEMVSALVCVCVSVCFHHQLALNYTHEFPRTQWVWSSSSAQFSRSLMSDSLWPHGLQHTRLPCPSPTPRACSISCPSNQWCQPSHPLSSPSPPTFNLSQHQGLSNPGMNPTAPKWASQLPGSSIFRIQANFPGRSQLSLGCWELAKPQLCILVFLPSPKWKISDLS